MAVATLYIKRIPAKITVICSRIIYPGLNKLVFDSEKEMAVFVSSEAFKSNKKACSIVVVDEKDADEDTILTADLVKVIKPIDNKDLEHVLASRKKTQ